MGTVGIVRKTDELGRIVLPVEVRRANEINEGDMLEIINTEDGILLKKHGSRCLFCGAEENLIQYKDKKLCIECKDNISKISK